MGFSWGVLFTNFNIEYKSVVIGERGIGWLSDLIIDASMEIICNQNPLLALTCIKRVHMPEVCISRSRQGLGLLL